MKTLANTERLGTFATDFSLRRSEPYDGFVIREGDRYVFEGKKTIDSGLALVITLDLPIREYRRTDRSCVRHIIRVFGSAFDALKPLDEVVCLCAQHGHDSSSKQNSGGYANTPYSWQWSLVCGTEQVWFPDTGECLIWPEDDEATSKRTAGLMPTLHGPVLAWNSVVKGRSGLSQPWPNILNTGTTAGPLSHEDHDGACRTNVLSKDGANGRT